jgi:hypothetical protein
MATQDFRVHISGGTVSLDNWGLAMEADERDLPLLSEAQKEVAQRIGMPEPEYARGVLAETFGEREQQKKGRRLGELIGDVLSRAGQGWRLETLIRRGTESVWVARFESEGDSSQIEIPLEIADDAVDSGGAFEKSRLEKFILAGLDRSVTRKAS